MAKKKKTSKFRGRVGADSKRQKAANSSYGYLNLPKGVNVYAPVPGAKEKIDILPYEVSIKNHPDLKDGFPTVGDSWYKRPFKVHKNCVGADNDSVVCLSTWGKKCPICEYRKKLVKEGAEEDVIKALKPSNRNLYVVIPIDHKKLEEIPHIFDMSQWLFQNLLNDEVEEKEEWEDFPDLEDGYTLKVRWEEKSYAKNKYADAGRIDFEERDAYDEEIVDSIPDLDVVLQELSYEEMYAKFHEIDVAEEEEDDAPPPKSKRKSKPKKEEEEEEIEHDLDWDDISDMDVGECIDVIEKFDLKADADAVEDVEELQKLIAIELNIEVTPEEKPVAKKKVSKKKKATPKKEEEECPNDHEFGTDNDQYTDCDDCPLWDACLEAN